MAEVGARTGVGSGTAPVASKGLSHFVMGTKIHHLAEFRPLLERLEAAKAEYAIIGGLAVAHYGEHYLSEDKKESFHFPIYSKDIDFCGKRSLYEIIQREAAAAGMQLTGGMGVVKPKLGTDRVPGYYIGVQLQGETTNVEIMEYLPLAYLEIEEAQVTGSFVTIDGIVVLDPCTLLLAKLAAYHERPIRAAALNLPPREDTNNDAAHCAILIQVIPAFLNEVSEKHAKRLTEYDPSADTWRLLRVLERGKYPLPGNTEDNTAFVELLRTFTLSWLEKTGKLADAQTARSAAAVLAARNGMHGLKIAELRPASGPGGWYWQVLFSQHGAPTHIAFIDAGGQVLAAAEAQPILASDRREGGILYSLDLLEPASPSYDAPLAANARRRYLAWLTDHCGEIQLDGLPADSDVSAVRLRLERLFVPLKLQPSSAGAPEVDRDSPEYRRALANVRRQMTYLPSAEKIAPKPFNVGECMLAYNRISILAAPGAGKSTLMKRVAVAYADSERMRSIEDDLPKRVLLPIFLRCRELRDLARRPIREIMRHSFKYALDEGCLIDAFEGMLTELIDQGGVLLLIDGLDEISDDGDRRIFVEHLHSFLKQHPLLPMILTSREAGYRAVAGGIADVCKVFQIAALEEEAVLQLCENWHAEVLGDKPKVREDARELARGIWTNDRIRNLVVNPLLLTTLLVVRRWIGRLPEKRVTLYGKAIEVLLMTWNTEAHTPIPEEEALPQLSYVACWMMQNGVQRIGRKKLLSLLKQARVDLEAELYGAKVPPHEFIDRIEYRSSLLMQVGQEVIKDVLQPVYEFRHLTFQEYLAARGVVLGQYPEAGAAHSVAQYLEQQLVQPEWSEVYCLSALMSGRDATELVHLLAESITQKKTGGHDTQRLHGMLLELMADGPSVGPDSAAEACAVIVNHSLNPQRKPNGYQTVERLVSGKYRTQVESAAFAEFSKLDPWVMHGPSEYIEAVARFEISPLLSSGASSVESLVKNWLVSKDSRELVKGCVLMSKFWPKTYLRPFNPIADEVQQKLVPEAIRLLESNEPHVLAPLGNWLTGLAYRNMISADQTRMILPRILEIIIQYGLMPPACEMSQAFYTLPLLPRGSLQFEGNTKGIITELWENYDKYTELDRKRVAYLVAWYSKEGFPDEKFLELFDDLEGMPERAWNRGEEILLTLGPIAAERLEKRRGWLKQVELSIQ